MRCDLGGQVAFVTGAAGAIGRVIAKRFADNGAAVIIADIDLDGAERVANGLPNALACRIDIRSADSVEGAIASSIDRFGRLDILVNNAGATQSGDFFKLDDAVWEDGFALKFYSYVRLARALWPLLKDAQGSVVNIIGAASKTPTPNFMIGGAVNAAITNFTKALAELGLRDGVAVRAVHPGMTVTGRLESLLQQRAAAEGVNCEDYEKQELARAGLRRYSQPQDIANVVAFLASPIAEQIHGTDVFIDGGATKTIL
jgi:3-oxoacyl-[acyl-carrier protein] reductase